jgi:hypothetical protein
MSLFFSQKMALFFWSYLNASEGLAYVDFFLAKICVGFWPFLNKSERRAHFIFFKQKSALDFWSYLNFTEKIKARHDHEITLIKIHFSKKSL